MPMIYKPGQPSEQQRWDINFINLYLILMSEKQEEEKQKIKNLEEED